MPEPERPAIPQGTIPEPPHPASATHKPSVGHDSDETTGEPGRGTPTFGPPAAPGEVGHLGPYRVVKQLGHGGMGAVYLAADTRLNRKLALKVMLPQYAANPAAKERFLREARAAAQITHDNVVTVYEADERDGVPYIAMQFLQGYPLDDYLKKKGNLPLPHVLRIGREAATGLAAAHKIGLVHRDIKPGNLWLEAPNGRVKVLDFGLAKPVDEAVELTASGAVVGTPAYMSPEQARGQKVDGRTDLFSLGVMLYRLCAGRVPFEGPNVMAVLMALGTEEPTPVREVNPAVPEPLAELIHQLLAKNADARPQTADEVARRLRAMLEAVAAAGHASSTVRPAETQPQVVYAPAPMTTQPEAPAPAGPVPTAEAEPVAEEVVEDAEPVRTKPRGRGLWVAVGFAAVLAAVAGVIIIKITNKDGTTTEIRVPDDATVTVTKDGKEVAKVGPGTAKKDAPAVTPKKDDPVVKTPPKADGPALPPPKPWVPPAIVPVGQSPFDKLDPKEIPEAERFDWQPKELVAVVGTHSPRTWTRMGTYANLAVSPDRSLVATGGQHSPLRVWDVATRKLKVDLSGYSGYAVAFTGDGKQVIGNGGSRWDLTGAIARTGVTLPGSGPGAAYGFWLSPDPSTLVSHAETSLTVWDIKDTPPKALAKFNGVAQFQAAATTDARRLAHNERGEKRILIHDITPGGVKERWRLDLPYIAESIAVSANGARLVATRLGARRRLWNLSVDPPTFVEFDQPCSGKAHGEMAFHPDEKRLVTQDADGSLRFWDVSGPEPKDVWAKSFPVYGLGDTNLRTRVGFAGDGGNTLVVFAGLGLVHFIDVSGPEPKWLNPIDPTEPAGGGIAFGGATGQVILPRAGDSRRQWWDFGRPKPAPLEQVAPVGTVASTPDGGKHAVWNQTDRTLGVLADGKSAGSLPGMSMFGALTTDGRTYWGLSSVSWGKPSLVKGWDVSGATPRALHSFAPAAGTGLQYRLSLHRNDMVLACVNNGRLTFWDLTAAEPRPLSTFPEAAGELSRTYVFPDGERVLTLAGSTPQLLRVTDVGWVKVWEDLGTAYGALAEQWQAPDGTYRFRKTFVAHPTGKWFVLYHKEVLAVRRSSNGSVVHTIPMKAPPQDLEFAPDGRHLFVANGFNTVYVLRLNDLPE